MNPSKKGRRSLRPFFVGLSATYRGSLRNP